MNEKRTIRLSKDTVIPKRKFDPLQITSQGNHTEPRTVIVPKIDIVTIDSQIEAEGVTDVTILDDVAAKETCSIRIRRQSL